MPNDGGPASPNSVSFTKADGTVDFAHVDGMTLRAWLAGQALAGTCAHPGTTDQLRHRIDALANGCVVLADAVIARLEQGDERA